MPTPGQKMLNTAKVFLVGLACLSTVRGSERKTGLLKKSNKAEQKEEVSEAPRTTLDNFCETYFDMKANWELNYPFILQRERGLEEVELGIWMKQSTDKLSQKKMMTAKLIILWNRSLEKWKIKLIQGNQSYPESWCNTAETWAFLEILTLMNRWPVPVKFHSSFPALSLSPLSLKFLKSWKKVASVSMEPAQNETEEQREKESSNKTGKLTEEWSDASKPKWEKKKKQEKFKQLIEAYTFLKRTRNN